MKKEEIKGITEKYIQNGFIEQAEEIILQYKKVFGYDDEIASMESITNIYKNNLEEAFNCVREGLKCNIFNGDLYFNMGNIYEMQGKCNRAYLCYEHALSYTDNKENKSMFLSAMKNLKLQYDIKVNNYSIIILTYNNLEYTKVCINSIRKYNLNNNYEIIIVDNNSTDGTVEWIKAQNDLKYILNKENKGFPAGCNQGISIAKENNDIFLLNNDTVIMANSIFNLRMGLYSDEKIGATGSVSNSVSYYQQINEQYDNFDEYINFSLNNNITDEKSYEQRVKLVGFAILIKRNVLNKVGLLDERFTPGNFEDDDISFRILKEGYKLLLCKDSYIQHFGSISFNQSNYKYSKLLQINSDKFKEKWGFSSEYSTMIRYDLIGLINEDKHKKINILEVGCACGSTLLAIKNKYPNSEIYGIEINENSAQIAKCFADVRDENIENSKLTYEEGFFDYIIFGDVLEHLYNPQKVLENIKKYLKTDGYILGSIPNIMHHSVVKDLLNGNWTYQDAGILDRTHVRFFTKNEIIRMFNEAGYANIAMGTINGYTSENDKNFIDELSKLSLIDAKKEFEVYQYLIRANINNIKTENFNKIRCNSNENKKQEMNCFIADNCDIRGRDKIKFGSGVVIQENCWLDIAVNDDQDKIIIDIGKGSNIGRRGIISASNKVVIGEKVLIGPNVYIADCQHKFSDIKIPIMDQGINSYTNEVEIGDGTWIGINSCILGNVSIGKNCVIGANTFVNKDIPDYSVAVGSPAKIIKMFDSIDNEWKEVKSDKDIDKILKRREEAKYRVDFKELKSIQVEVSSICNLKCPQCFNNIKGHKSAILSKEIWNEKIRPILPQLTDIHLVGIGEPLLCKDFFNYAIECNKLGISVHTTSNLQLVNEEIAERIVTSGIKYLSFSCDGATEETYSKIRINGSLEKLISSVKLINKYKKDYNSAYPKLILNFGALNCNIDELPDVVHLAKKLQVSKVIAYHDIIYVKNLKQESLYYNQKKSDEIFNKAKEVAAEYGIEYFCPGTFTNPIKHINNTNQLYCNYPYMHLWIYSDGRVGPCCMDFPDRIILGDLKESTMEKIWNDNVVIELRKSLNKNPYKECLYCAQHGKMDLQNKKYLIKCNEK